MVKFKKTIKLSYILFIITALFSSQCQSTTLNDWGRDHPRAKVTLDYWGEACSIDMGDPVLRGGVIPYFDCQSYLYGMLDAYLSVSKFIPKNQRVCLPINITHGKYYKTPNIFLMSHRLTMTLGNLIMALIQPPLK